MKSYDVSLQKIFEWRQKSEKKYLEAEYLIFTKKVSLPCVPPSGSHVMLEESFAFTVKELLIFPITAGFLPNNIILINREKICSDESGYNSFKAYITEYLKKSKKLVPYKNWQARVPDFLKNVQLF